MDETQEVVAARLRVVPVGCSRRRHGNWMKRTRRRFCRSPFHYPSRYEGRVCWEEEAIWGGAWCFNRDRYFSSPKSPPVYKRIYVARDNTALPTVSVKLIYFKISYLKFINFKIKYVINKVMYTFYWLNNKIILTCVLFNNYLQIFSSFLLLYI